MFIFLPVLQRASAGSLIYIHVCLRLEKGNLEEVPPRPHATQWGVKKPGVLTCSWGMAPVQFSSTVLQYQFSKPRNLKRWQC